MEKPGPGDVIFTPTALTHTGEGIADLEGLMAVPGDMPPVEAKQIVAEALGTEESSVEMISLNDR